MNSTIEDLLGLDTTTLVGLPDAQLEDYFRNALERCPIPEINPVAENESGSDGTPRKINLLANANRKSSGGPKLTSKKLADMEFDEMMRQAMETAKQNLANKKKGTA